MNKSLGSKAAHARAEVLHEIADIGLQGLGLTTTARRVVQIAAEAFVANHGHLAVGQGAESLRTLSTFGSRDSALSGDLWNVMERARDTSQVVQEQAGNHFLAAAPVRQGRAIIGAIGLERQDSRPWTTEESRSFLAISAQIGRVLGHLEDIRTHGEVARRLEGLVSAAEALISTDPLPDILKRIANAVQDLLRVDQCSVMLVNERKELTLSVTGAGSATYAARPGSQPTAGRPAYYGEVNPRRDPVAVMGMARKASDSVGSESGAAHSSSQPQPQSKPTRKVDSLGPAGLHSVPIFFHGGVIGMLILYGVAPGDLGDDEERLLAALSSLCGVAIGNAQRFERLLQTDHQLRLDDRLSTLGAVGAEIAHEIRNPINIIALLLHSLREEKTLPTARERDLDIIIEKLQHMDRVVTRTLELAKQREPQLEWVQPDEQIDNLLNFITHPAAMQAVLIHRVGTGGPLPAILMDRTHFDQILLNILLNALEVMPNGGILALRTYPVTKKPSTDPSKPARRGRPRKDPTVAPTGIGIAVSDTGPGIPPERLRELFTPFSSSRPQGTGLGLFVAHKLVTLHGGTIEVKSGSDGGTTFVIEFPVSAVGSEEISR